MGWRALIWFLRIVVILFLFRMLFRFVGGVLRGLSGGAPGPVRRAPRGAAVDLVRDPVCGTFVPKQGSPRAVVAGREHFFCSEGCRQRALAPGASAHLE